MPIKFNVQVNNGVEALGIKEKTITANEVVETVDSKAMARELHHLNPLIPEQVAVAVLDNFCEAAAQLMAMGYAVVLQSGGKAALRIYPDVHLNGRNINLARARELDPKVKEITLENAGELAARVGVSVRAKAECEVTMTELLLKHEASLQRKEVVDVPMVMKKGAPGKSASDDTTTDNSGDGYSPDEG